MRIVQLSSLFKKLIFFFFSLCKLVFLCTLLLGAVLEEERNSGFTQLLGLVLSLKCNLLLYPQHPAEGKDGIILALDVLCQTKSLTNSLILQLGAAAS